MLRVVRYLGSGLTPIPTALSHLFAGSRRATETFLKFLSQTVTLLGGQESWLALDGTHSKRWAVFVIPHCSFLQVEPARAVDRSRLD